jgi:hypothetical protein
MGIVAHQMFPHRGGYRGEVVIGKCWFFAFRVEDSGGG